MRTVHAFGLFLRFQAAALSSRAIKMSNSSPPRLLPALFLSLLVHALLLLGVFSELAVHLAVPAAPLEVTLATRASAAGVLPAPMPVARPPARPAVAPRADDREQKRSLPVAPAPAAVAQAPESAVLEVGSLRSTPLPAVDGVNADDLREYRISLAIAARRFKHYPSVAKARGWEGTSELALSISPHWSAPEVVVVRSSGHSVLDTQAREMTAQAARLTVLPERLQGRSFRMLLSMQFSLDDDQ